jgi:hypothetical protein
MQNDEMSKDLLAADGLIIGGLTAEDRDALKRLLDASRKRVRHLKIAAFVSWIAAAVLYPVLAAVGAAPNEGFADEAVATLLTVALWVAVLTTIGYASRWVVLQLRTFRAQLADIDSRLEFLCERGEDNERTTR